MTTQVPSTLTAGLRSTSVAGLDVDLVPHPRLLSRREKNGVLIGLGDGILPAANDAREATDAGVGALHKARKVEIKEEEEEERVKILKSRKK